MCPLKQHQIKYRNSFNVSATIFLFFSLFVDFQSDLSGHGNSLDDATPSFISDSGSPNTELPESEIKWVWHHQGGCHAHLSLTENHQKD